jgi:CelD/BcsL family acetyltransferase involved in cellulose biosynthesis
MVRMVELCAAMGGTYLVHGSPKQRSVPPGQTREAALDRARECLAQAARAAQRCGLTYCLEPLARADRHLTGRWESQRSPRLPLGGGAPPAEERIHAKFRANLRRRARRLGELGAVSLERTGGLDRLDVALGEFLALEGAGWKGERGTAIGRDPRLVAFYARIVRDAAARGALAIRTLRLDGRAVAVHLGLVHAGAFHLPKTAYDEALGAVSPGQLLQHEVLSECEARGLTAFEFLGPDMPWKRDWEPEHVPHDWLYVYRPSFAGRAMHTLKHRVRPAVKEALAWWR